MNTLIAKLRNPLTTVLMAASLAVPTLALAKDASVVLVHGAFADGSAWGKVIPILQKAGVDVSAAQLPLTSLSDDAAVASHLIDTVDGPVVLVGHSYGGAVITEAGNAENVEALVYVSAFTLDAGQSMSDILKNAGPSPSFKDAIIDGRGHARLSAESFATYFAPDIPPEEAAIYAATQGPLTVKNNGVPATAAAWENKPVFYVMSENDQIIPPQAQGYFAKKMKASTTKLPSSHAVMLSQPQAVADVILTAVEAVNAD
ncbi:MAG: alpha/beta fold hydrolase [Arenibacterium sp.]